jgi:hypothetical protein
MALIGVRRALLSPNKAVSAVSLAAYNFRGTFSSTASGAVASSSINIGAASSDRLVIVATGYQLNSATVSSVTVAGTSLSSVVAQAGVGAGFITLHAALVPAGSGSQTVAVTWSTGSFNTRGFAVWTATGLNSNTAKQTFSTASGTISIAVVASDFLFGIGFKNSAGGIVFSGGTQAPNNTNDIFTANPSASVADWIILATNASFQPLSGSANMGAYATFS